MSETSYERGYRQGIEGKPPASSKTPNNFLLRNIGPAPVWAWLIAAVALTVGIILWRRNSQASSQTANTSTTADSQIPQFVNQVYTNGTPPDDGNNGPPTTPPPPISAAKVWGGKVVSVNNNRAVVSWMASGADAYRVTINGPGFKNKVNTITARQASFSGLHAGHNYNVTVQPLVGGKPSGNPGTIDILTTKGRIATRQGG